MNTFDFSVDGLDSIKIYRDEEYKSVVKNKVNQLNQMSVRDCNEQFFWQLGIQYGAREVQAIRIRNVLAHDAENQGVEMIDGLKILQLLYAKSVLKMLRYEGNILTGRR